MRTKTNITFRTEWLDAIENLDESLQLAVFKAVANYIKDGTEIPLKSRDAQAVLIDIMEDIDKRAERKRLKAAERKAKRAPQPGFIPETEPEDLDSRAEGNLLVDWVMTNSGLKEFKRFDKPLLKELAVQISEWWREHPTDTLPTRERMAYEFGARFGSVVAHLAGSSIITRAKWSAYVAPFMR
ncbi:MAG: hypothetical protein HFJ94_01895 [Muribaculaceae bacterium]|nr:hypothetical protein [Muribaculaceae bacterium]